MSFCLGQSVELLNPDYKNLKGCIYMIKKDVVKVLMDNGACIVTTKNRLKPTVGSWLSILNSTGWWPEGL